MSEKYVLSPEQVARKAERAKERWVTRTPEQRAKDKERARGYEAAHRDEVNASHRAAHARRYAMNARKYIDAQARWARANRAKINARERRNRHANPQAFNEKRRLKALENREKLNAAARRWREANREKWSERRRDYHAQRKEDPNYRLAATLRKRLGVAIRTLAKKGSAVRDLGCSIEELKQYLEARFKPGMTWKNWSMAGWHIDHVKPLASFDLTDEPQFKEACHYTNLQPLWACDNLAKNRKIA